MLSQTLLVAILVALIVAVALGAMALARLAALARARDAAARDVAQLRGLLEAYGRDAADHERDIRTDLAIARNESAGAATTLRQEVADVMARQQQGMARELGTMSALQHDQLRAFGERLGQLTHASESRLEALRATIEQRLDLLRAENTRKLDEMRATVDEKLQATLEQRLGASFRQVSERLEQVHRGLGEMHALATGVGDLKRVLTNVKSRGTWGEVQLGALLADVLPPSQYAQNVATRPGSSERVEFAVRFPGRNDDGTPCWLPIDAKF